MHYEVYLEVDKKQKTTKKRKSDIVLDVAEYFRKSEKHIYKIISKFESNGENKNRRINSNKG